MYLAWWISNSALESGKSFLSLPWEVVMKAREVAFITNSQGDEMNDFPDSRAELEIHHAKYIFFCQAGTESTIS